LTLLLTAYFTIVPDGEATLSVRLEGPGQCQLILRETEHCGVYEAEYVVQEEGEYTIRLLADGKPVGDAPLRIFAVRSSRSVLETIEKQVRTELGSQSIDRSKQTKQTKQTTKSTTKSDTQTIRKETSVTTEKRTSEVDETHITCEFGLVLHGPGLTSGHVLTNRQYEFVVDTRRAIAGKLNVKVDGPGNVDLDLGLCDQGYSVRYTADEPGDYHFTLKYDGQVLANGPLPVHVLPADAQSALIRPCPALSNASSAPEANAPTVKPVAARVTEVSNSNAHQGPPNPSAVRLDTSVLTKSAVGKTCELLVDCENAGEGKLEASLDGIRSAADQLLLSHVSNRVFKVTYKINQAGEYKLVLRWAGQPLPGSPFTISAA
jgi:hypothetical protein